MLRTKNKRLNSKGETIVEVLIAIAVLSAALGGAYAITTSSQKTLQANHERYQAQLLANRQAEMLKSYANEDFESFKRLNGSLPFCAETFLNPTSPQFDPATDTTSCVDGPNGLYRVLVYPRERTVNGNVIIDTFLIEVTWDSLLQDGKDKVDLYYGI